MDRPSLLTLPPDVLRQKAVETVKRHWARPAEPRPAGDLSPERVEELSRAALDTMLTRQFRVGPLPAKDAYDQLLERVRLRDGLHLRVVDPRDRLRHRIEVVEHVPQPQRRTGTRRWR